MTTVIRALVVGYCPDCNLEKVFKCAIPEYVSIKPNWQMTCKKCGNAFNEMDVYKFEGTLHYESL
jgi:transcription elongation factor Elf1